MRKEARENYVWVKSRSSARFQGLGGRRQVSGFRSQNCLSGEIEARFPKSLVMEPVMLFKTKPVRRDFRKFSGSPPFLIILNSKELSDCGGERGACIKFSYVRSRKVIENK